MVNVYYNIDHYQLDLQEVASTWTSKHGFCWPKVPCKPDVSEEDSAPPVWAGADQPKEG